MATLGEWHAPVRRVDVEEDGVYRWLRRRPAVPIAFVGLAFLEPLALTVADQPFGRLRVDWFFLILGGYLLVLALALAFQPPAKDLDALMDSPSPVPQFCVGITFKDGLLTYGRDRGIITFIDGWLYFQGMCTEFSLRQCDVGEIIAPFALGAWTIAETRPRRWTLSRWAERTRLSMQLRPYGAAIVAGEWRLHQRKYFHLELLKWCSTTGPASEPIYPPAQTQSTWRPKELSRMILIFCACVAAGIAGPMVPVSIAAFLGAAICLLLAIRICRRDTWRDRAARNGLRLSMWRTNAPQVPPPWPRTRLF